MPTPLQLFADGRLAEALDAQRAAVRRSPGDAAARLFLCELLLFDGRPDQVREQLSAVGELGDDLRDYAEGYRLLLDAEAKRQRLLVDADPVFLGECPAHALRRLEAVRAWRAGDEEAVSERLDEADEASPHLAGHVDGREFEGLRDGDDRFASLLEVLVGEDYAWLPFEDVRRVRLGTVESPRDQLFRPARLRLAERSEVDVYLPALYVGSAGHPSAAIRLGRETDWSAAAGHVCGVGLRVWTFGEDEELTPWEVSQIDLRPA
jgi:type VI secretion system protein ImpE